MKCRLPKSPKISRATQAMSYEQINRALDIKVAEMDARDAEKRRREKAEREGIDQYQALEWLYKQLKSKRVALGHAESKPNATADEINDIKHAINTIEWIIGVILGGTP